MITYIPSYRLSTAAGILLLAECNGALCLCDWATSTKHFRNINKIENYFNGRLTESSSPLLESAISQLDEYFQGKRKTFTIPLNPIGTPFQMKVWSALSDIPYRKTLSYKDLAHSLNSPNATRAVANAVANNPLSIFFPCHRVIGTNNPFAYAGGIEAKRHLLALEGAYVV